MNHPHCDDEHDTINVGEKAVRSSKITDPEYHIDRWQQDYTGVMSCPSRPLDMYSLRQSEAVGTLTGPDREIPLGEMCLSWFSCRKLCLNSPTAVHEVKRGA